MKSIHLHGKAFDESDFRGIVIGGQNNADTIRFVVPKIFGGELDLTTWSWALTYENETGTGDTVLLGSKPSGTDTDNLWIDWKPGSSATIMKGRLLCQLYAYNSAGSKLTTKAFCIYISEALDPDPIVTPSPSYIEQALALMAQYNEELDGVRDETEGFKNAAANSAQAAKESETNAAESEQQSLEYKQAIENLKAQIETLEAAAQAAKTAAETAAETAQAQAEAAKEELYKLIGGIPEDFVTVNHRINALEACHLESRDDGIHLIIKQEENNG